MLSLVSADGGQDLGNHWSKLALTFRPDSSGQSPPWVSRVGFQGSTHHPESHRGQGRSRYEFVATAALRSGVCWACKTSENSGYLLHDQTHVWLTVSLNDFSEPSVAVPATSVKRSAHTYSTRSSKRTRPNADPVTNDELATPPRGDTSNTPGDKTKNQRRGFLVPRQPQHTFLQAYQVLQSLHNRLCLTVPHHMLQLLHERPCSTIPRGTFELRPSPWLL
jgi:hypothetical protein